MSVQLGVVKSKDFKVGTEDNTVYICSYKGRIISVNTLNVPKEEITFDATAKTVKLSGDYDLVNRPWSDPITNEVKVGLVMLPKLDISVSAF